MLRLAFLSCFVLSACGPDVAAWVGTYEGSGSINAGRQPEPLVGSLVVTPDARFTLTSTPTGTGNHVFTCALTASGVTATQASFTVPTTCALGVTPSDGCTHAITVNAASVEKTGSDVSGTVSGRVSSTCQGAGSQVSDHLLSFFGQLRP